MFSERWPLERSPGEQEGLHTRQFEQVHTIQRDPVISEALTSGSHNAQTGRTSQKGNIAYFKLSSLSHVHPACKTVLGVLGIVLYIYKFILFWGAED